MTLRSMLARDVPATDLRSVAAWPDVPLPAAYRPLRKLAGLLPLVLAVLLGGATALLPVYARDILDVGPWGLGLLRAGPGIGAVAVRNSGHFGTAMYFTRMAVQAGCVGFLSSNASPAMAPWGGLEKRIGTNPWSWAAPAGTYPPMMLDIANTAVARGKLYLARQRGEAIPVFWTEAAVAAATTATLTVRARDDAQEAL